jgi:hypothetical protein
MLEDLRHSDTLPKDPVACLEKILSKADDAKPRILALRKKPTRICAVIRGIHLFLLEPTSFKSICILVITVQVNVKQN